MAKKSIIKQYVESRSSSAVRARVNQIEINQLKIHATNNSVKSEVFGSEGDLYDVEIRNYTSTRINSSCNCPYDWNGLCKHEVAVLMLLDKQVNKQVIENVPKNKTVKYSKIAPYIIKPFDKIDAATIAAHSKPHYDYYATFKEEYLELNEHVIKLTLPSTDRYWENIYVTTTVAYKNKSLELTCDCNAINRQLCKHQNFALKTISSLISPHYFNSKHKEQQWKEQLKLYGYSLKDDYQALFTSSYQEGNFIITPKIEGLMPLMEKSKWQNFSETLIRKTSLEDFLHSKTIEKKQPSLILAVGISFDYNPGEIPIEAKLLTGKPNKSGELSTRITEVYSLDEINNIKNHFSQVAEAYQLTSPLFANNLESHYYKEHDDSDDVDSNYRMLSYPLDALSKLISELPKDIDIYIIEDDHYRSKLTKKDIELVSMLNQSTSLEFLLTEEEHFYKLECYVLLNEEQIKLPSERVNSTTFFAIIDHVYYLHKSIDYMATFQTFFSNSVQRIQKSELENYLSNFLIPLQKKYHVTIDINSITTVEKELSESKLSKRLYVSEVNDFVAFKPVIAVGKKILELGDNCSYTTKKEDVITYYTVNNKYLEQFATEITQAHPAFASQTQSNGVYLSFDQFGENRWFLDAFEYFKNNDIEVFGYNTFKKLKYNVNKPNIAVGVSSEIDWFDVSIAVSFGDETVPLSYLKKAVLKQESYIKLGDGSLGYLPDEWLKKMERYFRYGEISDNGINISKHHFSLIDELFDEIDDEELKKEIEEKKTKLTEFDRIKSNKLPRGITAKMRDYQTHGFNWLVFLNEFNMGGCLADDMGLGKTLQVICLLQHQKNKKVKEPNLVVVPTSLIFNWQNEIEKFAPNLKVKVISGAKRDKSTTDFKKYNILLITYGLILRDIDYLKEYLFNYTILDESQAIKNPLSKRYKAVRLLQSRHRLVMTGTPVENGTMDLYSQMSFVNPGLLGTAAFFKDYFAKAIEKDKDENRTEELKKLIKPFLIRRTKEQVATELPEKTEMVLYCELEPAQRNVYDTFKNKYKNYLLGKIEDEGLNKSKMYVLEGLLKLRQICNSPALLTDKEDYGNESIKIKELTTHIKENTGQHKILVFSQFVKMLDLIKKALVTENVGYEYLDGKTKNRQEKVNNFQHNDKVRVFLISLKAGGTGLNLTSADYVYIVDPWWNPAVEAQAIDRCYRIGQTKKVMAYKMICKDTVEEKIVELQNRKMKMVKDIISTDDSILKSLTKSDIVNLFS